MGRPRKNFDYEKKIQLKHNEIPAKINLETGEIIEVKDRQPNLSEDTSIWMPNEEFGKLYKNKVLLWLIKEKILTPVEIKVLNLLMLMSHYETNSLEPLNDDYAISKVAEELDINRNKVSPLLHKFYNLGIYARFDVKKYNVPYTKYWILNPYLFFNGRRIKNEIANLFKGTVIHLKFEQFYAR